MEKFAVKSDSFALYEAFKKDVEKIGWKYNEKFTPFNAEEVAETNCLFFANDWDDKPFDCSFSLTNSDDTKSFRLEAQYGEALAFAKTVWEQENKPKSMGCRLGQILSNSNATCSISVSSPLNGTNPFALYTPHLVCPYNPAFYDTTHLDLVFSVPTISQDTIDSFMGDKLKPKFKVGDWIRDITDGKAHRVLSISDFNGRTSYEVIPHFTIIEDILEAYKPKRGEYCYCKLKDNGEWLFISSGKDSLLSHIVTLYSMSNFIAYNSRIMPDSDIKTLRPATPAEIALLDSKLAEQGKRFDKEKLELVDISKYKEPIIGEMAIFWDRRKDIAIISVFETKVVGEFTFRAKSEESFRNAILFESPEQYKDFIKS